MSSGDLIWNIVATTGSFAGLVGIYGKRWWGPGVAALASGLWAAYAVHVWQPMWALVEAAYSLTSFATCLHWAGALQNPFLPDPPQERNG